MWFLFKILHVRGRNSCICKGELCFILLGGVFTSLLFYKLLLASCTAVLWPFLHILCLSLIYIYIYDDVCLFHLSLHVLFLLYLYTHVSLCMQSLFLLHTWCLDEFCLSVSENKLWKSIMPWTLSLQSFSRVRSKDKFIL